MDEVEAIPQIEKYPDIIGFTETWLHPKTEHQYKLHGYNAVYNSRETRGGGIAMFVKKGITLDVIIKKKIKRIEILTIKIKPNNIAISLIYRPPDVPFKTLKDTLKKYLVNRKKKHILMGDFNVNLIKKTSETKEYRNIYKERNYKIVNKTSKKHCT